MTAVLDALLTEETADCRVTTLFDAIGEMQETFGTEADEHVVASVMRLLQTGRMTFLWPHHVARALEDVACEPTYS